MKRKQRIPHDVSIYLCYVHQDRDDQCLELVKRFPMYSEQSMYIYIFIMCIYTVYYLHIYYLLHVYILYVYIIYCTYVYISYVYIL